MNSSRLLPDLPPDGLPVTVVTGFLGSGKTTLINGLLKSPHGLKLAVIENEFGAVGVDGQILVRDGAEEIIQTENGCLCCTVRGDLKRALTSLYERRAAGELAFDRVVIETTGLAQPAPVVQTLLVDAYLAARYRIDGVVTLVDALHGAEQLDRHPEAQEQAGFADRLILTKPDLVSPEQLTALADRLKDMNPRAAVRIARQGDVQADWVLDVGGFDVSGVLDLHPGFPRYARPAVHSPGVESWVHRTDAPFDRERLELFLETLLEWYGADLLRYKGILSLEDDPRRWIFQGVHRQRSLVPGEPWTDGPRSSVLVFIGTALPRAVLDKGLEKCAAGTVLA
ncbi:MAG: GTP-binding protein [Betaproteobacteria bacterium]|nr:GTP-binding protein [Betaproteobacteria bacterium]